MVNKNDRDFYFGGVPRQQREGITTNRVANTPLVMNKIWEAICGNFAKNHGLEGFFVPPFTVFRYVLYALALRPSGLRSLSSFFIGKCSYLFITSGPESLEFLQKGAKWSEHRVQLKNKIKGRVCVCVRLCARVCVLANCPDTHNNGVTTRRMLCVR